MGFGLFDDEQPPDSEGKTHELLINFAKVRYRKKMEKFTAVPHHIETSELEEQHQKTLYSTLEIVSDTMPMSQRQKTKMKQILDKMFILFKEINLQKQTSNGPAIGIDLGTTYCCMAVVRNDREPEIIPNDMGNNKTPSYVAFPNINSGENAEDDEEDYDEDDDSYNEPFCGETARDIAHDNPRFTIFDVKRMFGRQFNDIQFQHDMKFWPFSVLNGGEIKVKTDENTLSTPLEITVILLKHLKQLAENFIGVPVVSAVVAVPAFFNTKQREMTKEACSGAGLNVLQLVNEPTAAAVAYKLHVKSRDVQRSTKYLIFDFGGGTFDVAVLTLNADQIHVLAVGGESHLGGDDIDNRMVEYCLQLFQKKHGVNLNKEKESRDSKVALLVAKRLRRLKLECEKQKRFLTQVQRVVISMDAMHGAIPLVVQITRDVFNDLIKDILDQCINVVEQVLKESKIDKREIDDVVVVGGSSRIPKVQEMLSDFFDGKQLRRSIDADEAIAVGAAMLAFHAEKIEIPNVLVQEPETRNRAIASTSFKAEGDNMHGAEAEEPVAFPDTKAPAFFKPLELSKSIHWAMKIEGGPQLQKLAAVVIEDTIYSFGGIGNSGPNRDFIHVHVLKASSDESASNMKWKFMLTKLDWGNYPPRNRFLHTCVTHGQYVYLWGGDLRGNDRALYRFNTKTFFWQKPSVKGVIPYARDSHVACVVHNKMYVFGGFCGSNEYSPALHALSLKKFTWSVVYTSGTPPTPRYYQTAVVYKKKHILIFGGMEDSGRCSNELTHYDTEKKRWFQPRTTGEIPKSRCYHSAFMHQGFMYIFGGYNSETNECFNDLFRYNPETMHWQEVVTMGQIISPRCGTGCAVVGNRAFIFGGRSPDYKIHKGTFVLEIN